MVSFKIDKKGKRYIPKAKAKNEIIENSNNKNERNEETKFTTMPMLQVDVARTDAESARTDAEELEVSFILNVYPDGFCFGKPSEAMMQHPPKSLHPYDRKAEAFFSAIECGRVPVYFLDDIPCKYVGGKLLCEVRDYRNCFSEAGSAASSRDVSPITNKVCLKMSLENVIKDIPLIFDKPLTNHDLIEVESRIMTAMQPQLRLDPTPKLDRLCESPIGEKLNLDIRSHRIKRLREKREVTMTSNNNMEAKKVRFDKVSESRSCRVKDVEFEVDQNRHDLNPDFVTSNPRHRFNSLPKRLRISGVGSSVGFGNMPVLSDANSPADDSLTQIDPMMLHRFLHVQKTAARYQLGCRKNKVDEIPIRKDAVFSSQQVMEHLSNDSNGENLIDESENKELKKSFVGGSKASCKIRVLDFAQNEQIMQENGFALPKLRLMLSSDPINRTIAMHYGELSYSQSITEEYLPTLPSVHYADLLATQLSSLMIREGYVVEDRIYLKQVCINDIQKNGSGMPQTNSGMEIQQSSEAVSGQQHYKSETNSSNSLLTPDQNDRKPRMLPSPSAHGLQVSQGFLAGGLEHSRPQQNEPQSSLQEQRSSVMFPPNQLPQVSVLGQNSNSLLGNTQMVHRYSERFKLMHPRETPRKTMTGMRGDTANNVAGLGGFNNVMSLGGTRGIGGPTMSGPMGQISYTRQNTISQQIGTDQLASQALLASTLRMTSRGIVIGESQAISGGIQGEGEMYPGPVWGNSLNRSMNPMERAVTGYMGPPQLMRGMNPSVNPHQQQQQQQQEHQMFQQPNSASPLQAVFSLPQQIGQQFQQYQSQPAASPQLSSQTVGSYIANSPMEQLHGANNNI